MEVQEYVDIGLRRFADILIPFLWLLFDELVHQRFAFSAFHNDDFDASRFQVLLPTHKGLVLAVDLLAQVCEGEDGVCTQ